MLGILFYSLLACDADIGIAQEKVQNDTYSEQQEIPDDSEFQEEDAFVDFLQRGSYEVEIETKAATVTGCEISYSIYRPAGVSNPPVVVLGHGFARGPDTMTGWADHLATWGITVLLPSLCHYNVFAGVDHELNGKNMMELADYYGSEETIYAGHSAGGLAAIIAASIDTNSLGVLGLDATDTENVPGVPDFIGQNYASGIDCVGFSIMGEPSSCNSDGNGLTLFEMMNESYVIKVDDADHCDFESPTDAICEISCENTETNMSDEEIRSIIFTLGTSAIMSLSGLSSEGWILWR